MSRIRSRGTGPEREVAAILRRMGVRHEEHASDLPGTPDFVLRRRMVAVFVEGDFWHGWRFPLWRASLAPYWRRKIEANRARDARNHARLRRMGWRVLRVWEHDLRGGRAEAKLRAALAGG